MNFKPKSLLYMLFFIPLVFIGCENADYLEDYKSANPTIENDASYQSQDTKIIYDEYNDLGLGADYITADETGLYYIALNRLHLIHYYSFKDKTDVILCSKLNCNHSTSDCNAYLSSTSSTANSQNTAFLKFYSNKLYTIDSNETGIFLDSLDIDGSNKIRIGNIYPDDIPNVAKIINGRLFDNRYLYLVVDTDSNVYYYQIELNNNSKPELLFKRDSSTFEYLPSKLQIINGGIIFSNSNSPDIAFHFDLSSKTISELYTTSDNYSYFGNANSIYCLSNDGGIYQLVNNNLELLFQSDDISPNNTNRICNNNYIIIDRRNSADYAPSSYAFEGERYFYIYDIKSKTLKKLDLASTDKICSRTDTPEIQMTTMTALLGISNSNMYYWNVNNRTLHRIDLKALFDGRNDYDTIMELQFGYKPN